MSAWHLDKTVPIALIFTIAMQGAIGIWWASDITSRLIRVEASENSHTNQVEALVKLQDSRYERIVRLEEKLASQSEALARIEKKLDSLAPGN